MSSLEKPCAYCVYRSLCNRGVQAGEMVGEEEEPMPADINFDLEQIGEIGL
jgi:hypothetical protein